MGGQENTKYKRQLELIIEAVSNDVYNLGEKFFENIVLKLNEVLDSDYTFIGKLLEDKSKVETISLVNRNGVIDNFIYDLEHTPCDNVIGQNPCSYVKDVTILFPKDQLLIDMGIEGYVGVPLYDSKKNPTGILVCLFKNEILEAFAIESILMIFASRASAELEHMKLYGSLEKTKQNLELKIKERTKEVSLKNTALKKTNLELEKTIQNLHKTQDRLIQSEKMASIGILTAGVAHEINNPLNYLKGAYDGFCNYFEENESLDSESTDILMNGIQVGIERISGVIKGLNQFSRNNASMDEPCDVHAILNNCLEILKNQTKNKISIEKKYSKEEVIILGNSGKIHQIFLNILTNSIQAILEKGSISIHTFQSDKQVKIKIVDSGIGVAQKDLNRINDPFFTTKSPGDGTGLGLYITYALVLEHNGAIDFKSKKGIGTSVAISLPKNYR